MPAYCSRPINRFGPMCYTEPCTDSINSGVVPEYHFVWCGPEIELLVLDNKCPLELPEGSFHACGGIDRTKHSCNNPLECPAHYEACCTGENAESCQGNGSEVYCVPDAPEYIIEHNACTDCTLQVLQFGKVQHNYYGGVCIEHRDELDWLPWFSFDVDGCESAIVELDNHFHCLEQDNCEQCTNVDNCFWSDSAQTCFAGCENCPPDQRDYCGEYKYAQCCTFWTSDCFDVASEDNNMHSCNMTEGNPCEDSCHPEEGVWYGTYGSLECRKCCTSIPHDVDWKCPELV
eukprot:UN27839